MAKEANLQVHYDGPDQSRVVASVDASALDYLLEVTLGSVGLQGTIAGSTLTVTPLQPQPAPRRRAPGTPSGRCGSS